MTKNLSMCRILVLTALAETNATIREFHDEILCSTVWMNG